MAVIVSVLATLIGVGIGNRLAVSSTDTATAPTTRTVPTQPGSTLPPSSSDEDPSSQNPSGQATSCIQLCAASGSSGSAMRIRP